MNGPHDRGEEDDPTEPGRAGATGTGRDRTARARTPSPPAVAALVVCAGLAACALPEPPGVAPDVSPPAVAEATEEAPLPPELRPVPAPTPPRPWLGARLDVAPSVPREGRALAVRVETPRVGRPPLSVEGRLGDGTEVRFGRLPDGSWLGLAPLPVGESGPRELVIRMTTRPDSTVTLRRRIRVEPHRFPSTQLSVAPRYSSPPPEVMDRIEREREMIGEALSAVTDDWLWEGRFTWPRPRRVTSPFGQRRVFNGELRSRHWGLDLGGPTGAPVRAAARGRVVLAHHLYYAGNTVFLDHGHGVFTGYSHLSEIGVRVGDTVESGEVVGEVGATGRVTGPHLHWTLRVGGVRLDASSLMSLEVF